MGPSPIPGGDLPNCWVTCGCWPDYHTAHVYCEGWEDFFDSSGHAEYDAYGRNWHGWGYFDFRRYRGTFWFEYWVTYVGTTETIESVLYYFWSDAFGGERRECECRPQ